MKRLVPNIIAQRRDCLAAVPQRAPLALRAVVLRVTIPYPRPEPRRVSGQPDHSACYRIAVTPVGRSEPAYFD